MDEINTPVGFSQTNLKWRMFILPWFTLSASRKDRY